MTLTLREQLESAYGERVKVVFIDTQKSSLNSYPSIAQVVQMGYGFPIVSIDGQPRLAGGIDLEAVKAIIDEIV